MKEQNSHERKLIDDILPVAVGEAVVALLVICGALLLNLIGIIATFDFKIILGALLGEGDGEAIPSALSEECVRIVERLRESAADGGKIINI